MGKHGGECRLGDFRAVDGRDASDGQQHSAASGAAPGVSAAAAQVGRERDRAIGQARPCRVTVIAAAAVSVLTGALTFCIAAAMIVVFVRALTLPEVLSAQDAENHRLWQAIASMGRKSGGA